MDTRRSLEQTEDPSYLQDLQVRLDGVRSRIATAATSCGRSPSDVTLVAVSKGQSSEAIRAAYSLGLRDFGENYVQEWLGKKAELADLTDLRWHLIGHLQSNKAKSVALECYCIQTIDRISVAEVLERTRVMKAKGQVPRLQVLVQLEVDAQDPNKFGARPGKETDELCKFVASMPELEWKGFMGIGPPDKSDEELAALYATFVSHSQELWQSFHPFKSSQLPVISLGMTSDLDVAIASGSSMIRVGTGIFGTRSPKNSPVT